MAYISYDIIGDPIKMAMVGIQGDLSLQTIEKLSKSLTSMLPLLAVSASLFSLDFF
jgi:hypothetical protein